MKLADYVIQFFADKGVEHCYGISGGAAIHLFDSAARNPKMNLIFTQHEQGAGAAADMYARVSKGLGLTLVTSGPGATNLVTSVCNAYFDSIPLICLSGQVATFRLRTSEKLRQRGFQETDTVSIFKSITKYSARVLKAEDIRYELEKAVYLATEGRPGPAHLDIPDDLQRVEIEPSQLRSFEPPAKTAPSEVFEKLKPVVQELAALIEKSHRPVLILGAGVHASRTEKQAVAFAERLGLPTLLTWGALDLLPRDHHLNLGGLGVVGPRSGNFAAQNSDLVISLGTRLSQMITGGKQNLFAPGAKKVMIDIDAAELAKFGKDSFELDIAALADLRDFFEVYQSEIAAGPTDRFTAWIGQVAAWDAEFPICEKAYWDRVDRVNAYVFMEEFSKHALPGAIVITDAGGNLSWTMQGIRAKAGQEIYSAWNHSPMGYSLPAAMGAAVLNKGNVQCIVGDGGLMMCLEELGTIKRHEMPVKIFVFNNRGHGIQKQTIETWLDRHYVGVDEATGLFFPDYELLTRAFGLVYRSIANHADLKHLAEYMNEPGPALINVEIAEDQRITPMLKFGAGLEDLDPKIPAQRLGEIVKKKE